MPYTAEYIKLKLMRELDASHVEVIDESDGCGAKFSCVIVSNKFEGKALIRRHRLVNTVLQEELKSIHAFSQKTYSPQQWEELRMSNVSSEAGSLKDNPPKTNPLSKGFSICVSAPGKVIIHGEHSVVYGKMAFAGSLGLRTQLFFKERDVDGPNNDVIEVMFQAISLKHRYNLKDVRSLLANGVPMVKPDSVNKVGFVDHESLLERIESFVAGNHSNSLVTNQRLTPFTVIVTTELNVSSGLGSSASFAVVLAGTFHTYVKYLNGMSDCFTLSDFDLKCISKWAFNVERIMHGTPSGLDNTICCYGSIVEFRKGSPLKPVLLKHKLQVMLINIKVVRDTKVLVQHVAELKKRVPIVVDTILDSMDQLAVTALENLLRLNDVDVPNQVALKNDAVVADIYNKVEELFDINQNLLRSLGISHPTLDDVCAVLLQNGFHGKLTGAGGGGHAIAVIPPNFDINALEKVVKALMDKDFEVTVTDIGGAGVAVDQLN